MTGRLPHAAAAAFAALLAAAAARIVGAEHSFEAGLARAGDAELGPSADVPGRLEDYEEAMRRDPGEAQYALRASQIRLRRASAASPGPARSAELAAARRQLEAAVAARPLDAAVRATVAQLERMERNTDAALSQAALALELGPRAKGPLTTALAIGIAAYRDSAQTRGLALALSATRRFLETGEPFLSRGGGGIIAEAFRQAGPELAADVLEATADDPALRALAARIAREVRPETADAIEAFVPGAVREK